MARASGLAVAGLCVAVACSGGTRGAPATPGWDAAALAVAARLADAVRAAGVACDDYSPWDHALLSTDYAQKGIPLPAAVAACTGDGGEDLTFEVFADAAQAAAFVSAKRRLLCGSAARGGVPFDGFPYVDGGTWLVEPDEPGTASRLAAVLHATATRGGC